MPSASHTSKLKRVNPVQEFFQGVKETDRENEVYRILGAFKLNPFEQLNLKFDASVDDVKKAYRKSSLLVHPDKCRHPKAQDAFEMLGQAQQALNNEDKMRELRYVLTLAQGMHTAKRSQNAVCWHALYTVWVDVCMPQQLCMHCLCTYHAMCALTPCTG